MNWIEVITSVERRRRWSRAEKARWVAAMEEPERSSRRLRARRASTRACCIAGVDNWRRRARRRSFVPVAIADDATGACGGAGAATDDHDRIRRACSHDGRRRAGCGDAGERDRRADGADRWR